MNAFGHVRARLGDYWWYSALLFVALRVGDLINAFIGLWLVPRFVPAFLTLSEAVSLWMRPSGSPCTPTAKG